jgi:putative transposase
MKNTQVARLLAFMTGMVNQQILLQNEYLAAENRILRAHLPDRLRLTDPQRATLAAIGKRLGRRSLQQVARVARPDTILAWYRKLIAQKFAGSKYRRCSGRPSISREVTELVLRRGYDRIAGALDNLGHHIPASNG